jgi:predicted SnoaL-like aldol condensation-catalyzing enzyme
MSYRRVRQGAFTQLCFAVDDGVSHATRAYFKESRGIFMKKLLHTLAVAGLVVGLIAASGTSFAQTQAQTRDLAQEEANRKLVLDFYDQVFVKHEVEKAAVVLADDYIQHNPLVPTGKAPFVNFFTGFFKANPQAKGLTVRSATDGDLVFLHNHATTSENDRGRAIVDIFRVKDGKIVEHWDVIQPVPETAANTNTMF